jgi:hypothetical protein
MSDKKPPPPRMILKISPSFDSRKLENKTFEKDFNDFVDVYENRINGWLLCWAHEMNKHEHAGFASLQLAMAFFEGFAVFYYGKDSNGKSPKFFDLGFRLVFPQMNQIPPKRAEGISKKLYHLGRCGLFHLGMVRTGVYLRDGNYEIDVHFDSNDEVKVISVDRCKFVQAISRRFDEYIKEIRDVSNVERRTCFAKAWEIFNQEK